MVKHFSVLLLVLTFAVPVLAQDYPQVEISLGYGNIGAKNLVTGMTIDGRHSGFVSQQAFNINSWLGIENYFGYYGLGTDQNFGKTQLMTNVFGARLAHRTDGPVFYVSGGLGPSWLRLPDLGGSSNNTFTVKYGGGVDIPIRESIAWRVEVSRMSFHFDGWKSGANFTTGLVLKITQ